MNNDLAVLTATYSDFKLIKTRGVLSLSFEVPIEQADLVHNAIGIPQPGKELSVAIARLNDSKRQAVDSPRYGDYAAKLYKCGFFLHTEVWRALGTDEDFLAWIRTRPSCIDGNTENIEACHVRRVANGAGTAIKPEYSAVPMTHDQHHIQTVKGEAALLSEYRMQSITVWNEWDAKAYFDKQRLKHLQEWSKERLKAMFSADSLVSVSPAQIAAWAEPNNLSKFLP